MRAWKNKLSTVGEVETFDYAYMQERRRRPDPLPLLVAAHREALHRARKSDDQPTILVGKSMGGRIGCHVSLEQPVNALVCFGYPLCGGGDPQRLRDKVLRDLRTPVLFVQGTRDRLCPLELLNNVRREMKAENFLHVVEGGDHSLLVGKRQLQTANQTQDEVDQGVLDAVAKFLQLKGSQFPGCGGGLPSVS